jgi:hypothetical protein
MWQNRQLSKTQFLLLIHAKLLCVLASGAGEHDDQVGGSTGYRKKVRGEITRDRLGCRSMLSGSLEISTPLRTFA